MESLQIENDLLYQSQANLSLATDRNVVTIKATDSTRPNLLRAPPIVGDDIKEGELSLASQEDVKFVLSTGMNRYIDGPNSWLSFKVSLDPHYTNEDQLLGLLLTLKERSTWLRAIKSWSLQHKLGKTIDEHRDSFPAWSDLQTKCNRSSDWRRSVGSLCGWKDVPTDDRRNFSWTGGIQVCTLRTTMSELGNPSIEPAPSVGLPPTLELQTVAPIAIPIIDGVEMAAGQLLLIETDNPLQGEAQGVWLVQEVDTSGYVLRRVPRIDSAPAPATIVANTWKYYSGMLFQIKSGKRFGGQHVYYPEQHDYEAVDIIANKLLTTHTVQDYIPLESELKDPSLEAIRAPIDVIIPLSEISNLFADRRKLLSPLLLSGSIMRLQLNSDFWSYLTHSLGGKLVREEYAGTSIRPNNMRLKLSDFQLKLSYVEVPRFVSNKLNEESVANKQSGYSFTKVSTHLSSTKESGEQTLLIPNRGLASVNRVWSNFMPTTLWYQDKPEFRFQENTLLATNTEASSTTSSLEKLYNQVRVGSEHIPRSPDFDAVNTLPNKFAWLRYVALNRFASGYSSIFDFHPVCNMLSRSKLPLSGLSIAPQRRMRILSSIKGNPSINSLYIMTVFLEHTREVYFIGDEIDVQD